MLNDKIDGLLFVIEGADGLPTEQTRTVFRLLTQAGLQPVTCTG